MSEFLFEILAEEIPAGVLPGARTELLENVAKALADQRIAGTFFAHATSRRLILFSRDLPEGQEDRAVEAIGPSVKVAFDAEGRPTRAAEGFARSQEISVESLAVVSTAKGDYVAARKIVPGRPTSEVLESILPGVLSRMTFPRMMRWGVGTYTWVRPVHSVIALFDGLVVPVNLYGVEAGRTTVGHRIFAPGRIVVIGIDDYLSKLRSAFVEPEYGVRRRILGERADALAAEVGCTPGSDAALLETLAYLVEFPGLNRGAFDEEYLELPEEVLVTSMREHQKVLPLRRPNGSLAPYFLAVADNPSDPKGLIVKGNEWVIGARFADARFFWDDDTRVPLEERLPRLGKLQFQEKLGDVLQKTERIQKLAREIADRLGKESLAAEAVRAARLLKADLVTDMVREFTDLQGIVGGLYARGEGEPEPVWQAIYDQYRPASPEDDAPRGDVGGIVGLADRLDTLAGFFGLGLVPTGSKDPYALRRAALAVVKIVLDKAWHLDLPVEIQHAAALHPAVTRTGDEVDELLWPFLLERFRFLLERRGFRHDEVESVLSTDCSDLTDAAARVAAVAAVRKQPEFTPVALAFKRIQNILAQVEDEIPYELEPSLVTEPAEMQLAGDYYQAKEILDELIVERRYEEALGVMASLGPSLDRFFAEVLVMAPDEKVRGNRLCLLRSMRDQLFRVARFSEIQA